MSAAAVLLALASAAVWGTADFSGGLVSRYVPTIPVTVISQAAGFAALLVVVAIHGGKLEDARSASACWQGSAAAPASQPSTRRSRSAR